MIRLATPIELIEDYLAEKASLAESSRIQYAYVLRRYYRWVKMNALDPQNIKIRDLVVYYKSMDKFSDLTRYSHFTVLKNHFKWIEENSLGANNLKENHYLAKLPRQYKTFRKMFLTLDQLKQLLEQPDRTTITGARDFAMMNLLAFNGIRIIEVCRANWGDITDDGEGLYIQRKGSKEKSELIRLSMQAKEAINDYLVMRENLHPNSPLISVHSWNHTTDFRYNPRTASQQIKRYLNAIGLKSKKYTAHSLRHTAAVMLLQMNVGEHDLQRYMGHANFSTSQLYLRALDEGRIYQQNLSQKIADAVYNLDHSSNLIDMSKNDKNSPFLERQTNFKSNH